MLFINNNINNNIDFKWYGNEILENYEVNLIS